MIVLLEGGFDDPQFGCWAGDFGCYANEAIVRTMIGAIVGLGDFTADIIVNAFDQSISDDEWGIAFGQWGIWAGVMLLFVAIVALYQITVALIMQNRRRLQTTVLGATFSVPLAAIAVMLMARMVGAIDTSSQKVIETIQGGQMGKALIQSLGINVDAGQFNEDSAVSGLVQDSLADQSVAAVLPAFFLTLLMMLAGVFLVMAMAFREQGLLILAALAPIALMMLGQGKLSAWAEKWFSLVAGLTLMKPLVIGIISLVVSVSAGTAGRTFAEILTSVLIIFFCAFAPFWVVKLVDFTGGELGAAMANRPSIRGGSQRMTSVVNNRAVKSMGRMIAKVFKA